MDQNAIIGLAGLGTMGLGIAQVFLQAGHRVIATDEFAAARESAPKRLRDALERRVARGRMTAEARDAACDRLTVAPDSGGMADCALVIEAIIESPEAKRALFSALEEVVASDAILATNTSSLSVTELAQGLREPQRMIGLHFFNPAPAMKLVELVRTPHADPAALDRAEALVAQAGKTVIRCDDRPGFIVNRCARPFYGEALAIVEEGAATPGAVDAAMQAAGYRLGPFSLIDLVGADINLAASETVSQAMGGHPRYHVFDALRRQVAQGDLGRKSGKGFIHPDPLPEPPADAAGIVARIEATLLNEAESLRAEGGCSAEDIDTALRLGLNFPRGPFEAGQAHGRAHIAALLDRLERDAPAHLRGRYTPQGDLGKATG